MVKKFTANCHFQNGNTYPVVLFVGSPANGSHPLGFQSKWLSSEKGGTIPNEVMESFEKLQKIAEETNVPFEDLCSYVIEEINNNNKIKNSVNKASEIQKDKE